MTCTHPNHATPDAKRRCESARLPAVPSGFVRIGQVVVRRDAVDAVHLTQDWADLHLRSGRSIRAHTKVDSEILTMLGIHL